MAATTRPTREAKIESTHGGATNFSSNAGPLEVDISYSPFGLYAMLEQNGDFSAAAMELSRQGYCLKSDTPPSPLERDNQSNSEWECITLENIYSELLLCLCSLSLSDLPVVEVVYLIASFFPLMYPQNVSLISCFSACDGSSFPHYFHNPNFRCRR